MNTFEKSRGMAEEPQSPDEEPQCRGGRPHSPFGGPHSLLGEPHSPFGGPHGPGGEPPFDDGGNRPGDGLRKLDGERIKAKQKDSLEMRIGMYWLHRLGIISFVFGIVYLITSSFNSFEPIYKLLVGVVVAGVLFFLGEKMSGKQNQKWFANGLTAAAWSLAYFTAYAAHYIPSVRVITSLPAETMLLILVAAGSLWSSLRARSELMSIYSIVLATITILMNGPSLFSDISFLIIAITTAVLANTQTWRMLFAVGLAACYIGHFGCSLNPNESIYDHVTTSIFLCTIWLAFTLGIGCSTRFAERDRNFATGLACANSLVFAGGLALVNDKALENLHQWIFAISGVIYLCMSGWLKKRNQEQLWTVHSLLGLFFINAAKVMHFSGMSLLSADVFQIALLAVVGLKYKLKTFQWVAGLLTVFFIPAWMLEMSTHVGEVAFGITAFPSARLGLVAAVVLTGLAHLHMRDGKGFYTRFYSAASNITWGLLFTDIIDMSWRAFAFALLAVANFWVGLRRKDDFFVSICILGLIASSVLVAMTATSWTSLPIALLVVTLYFGYAVGRTFPKERITETAEDIKIALPYLGNVLLTVFLMQKLPDDFVSAGLGVEGMVLLVAGFLLKERFFRLCGLVVLAILTGKLLFFDMATQNPTERIFSFIAAGVVFLLSSYTYGKFTHSFDDDKEKSEPEVELLQEINP